MWNYIIIKLEKWIISHCCSYLGNHGPVFTNNFIPIQSKPELLIIYPKYNQIFPLKKLATI